MYKKWYVQFGKLFGILLAVLALFFLIVYIIIRVSTNIPDYYFVSGTYSCIDNRGTLHKFIISEIDYDTYISSYNTNVVKDEAESAPHEYYSLYWTYSGDNIKGQINLVNARYSYHEGNTYVFDNNSLLTLKTPANNLFMISLYDFYEPGENDILNFKSVE